jgi:hypothetical protein
MLRNVQDATSEERSRDEVYTVSELAGESNGCSLNHMIVPTSPCHAHHVYNPVNDMKRTFIHPVSAAFDGITLFEM